MRRDSNDKEWQRVKEEVKKRDKEIDRMIKVCSPVEYILYKKNAGNLINIIDPAHVIPVSEDFKGLYKSCNICSISRWAHSNLDSFKSPITGQPISKEEINNWWLRILYSDKNQFKEFIEWRNLCGYDTSELKKYFNERAST